jgi:tryptophan 7-halogenase
MFRLSGWEATVPNLRHTLEFIGIDERDFLLHTNGTFKQAIRFEQWRQPGVISDYFFHPFDYGAQMSFPALVQHWLATHPNAGPQDFARATCVQPLLCERMRSPFREGDQMFHGSVHYAYHTHACLLAGLLSETAKSRGVVHVAARVTGVERAGDDDVAALVLDDGRRVVGDLFIDCSGFRSLLLEQEMGVAHRPFAQHLLCDSAVAMRLPANGDRPLAPYTRAIAQPHGWIWRIPLFNREGCGFVYSSAHLTRDQAETHLRREVMAGDEVPAWHLQMRTGCHERYWEKNCIGIGLAAGFIEPLESTGIYITEIGLRLLADNFPRDLDDAEPLRREFNRAVQDVFDELVNFITFHYAVAGRNDTAFWQEARSPARHTDRLRHLLDLWRYRPPGVRDAGLQGAQFNHLSYVFILAGMLPDFARQYPLVGELQPRQVEGILAHVAQLQERELARLPDHRAWLAGLRAGAAAAS